MKRAWAIATCVLTLVASPLAHAECRGSPLTFVSDPAAVDPASASSAAVRVAVDETAAGAAARDRSGRLVAPVMVNGQGPYSFIIDTGANRSAISTALGAELGLVANGSGPVHTVDEVAIAPMVDVTSIEYAGVSFGATQAPMIGGPVLAGQDGLLGVDGMRGRRLVLDFQHRCFEISDAGRSRALAGWTRIRGELRFGHLVLIPAEVSGHRINVLIDTGAGSSLANTALQRELGSDAISQEGGADLVRAFTAGNPIILNSRLLMPSLQIGEISADNVTAYIGDFHIFDLWGLRDQPTLLIGMDVLSKARAIAIDYRTGAVYFRIEQDLRTGSMIRGVTNGPITAFTGRADRSTPTAPY